jgi:transcriptional regulator with XRE-family HTH domain
MQTTRITSAKPDELRALGQAVRRARAQQNTSLADLACTLGIAEQRLEAIEDGQGDLGYKLLRAIAGALGVTSSDLLARAEMLEPPAGPDLSVQAMLARHGERAATPAEFQEHFGELPTDGEG